MKIGKAKEPGIAGYTPTRKRGDPTPPGHPRKRPELYREEYCQSIVEYFAAADSWEISYDLKKSGKVLPKSKLPTIERWCHGIGISTVTATMVWPKKHPEFAEALATAKDLQKAFLLELGAAGVANHVTALMLRTNHGMKEEKEEKPADNLAQQLAELVGKMPS